LVSLEKTAVDAPYGYSIPALVYAKVSVKIKAGSMWLFLLPNYR